MLRIMGALMIISAGSAIGFIKAESLKRRTETIGKIIVGLNLLESDIGFGHKDLGESLMTIGKSQGIELFIKTAKHIKESGARVSLSNAIEGEENLNPDDKASLSELGQVLGITDSCSQVKAIKRAVSMLSELKSIADEDYRRLGKLYRESGVLGGILGAVILI